MKFTKDLLECLKDSGQGICVFSNQLTNLLLKISKKSFNDFSQRSYYFWKNQKRPIPLNIAIKILTKTKLKFVKIEYFSIKGGNKIKFPEHENDAFCYFLGIILGAGCLIHSIRNKRNSWSVQITTNSKEKKDYLNKLIWDLFEVETAVYNLGTYYNLHIFSKPFVMILNKKYELPVGLKYGFIKVPEIIQKKITWKKSFIKGVFECDGNIYNYRGKKSVQLRQKSKDFLIGIRKICNDLGIIFNEPYYDRANNSWLLWTCKKSVVDNFIKKISNFKIKAPVTQSG
ncbi:MAG: LAGLIDADG family homing endonuclease [Nanoarchaeota archaeon]|nr:LAGLIDADG family homing endonuclease [Nanoarchaeota archaeon]